MLGKQPNFRKAVNFKTSNTNTNQSRNTATSQNGSSMNSKTNEENSQESTISVSHVVSSAENVCSEARDIQQLELVQRSCKIDEFCKGILSKSRMSPQDGTVSLFPVLIHYFQTQQSSNTVILVSSTIYRLGWKQWFLHCARPTWKDGVESPKRLIFYYTSCKQSTILADFDGFRINYDHDDNSNVEASCTAAQVFLRFMLKSSKD